MKEEHKKKVRKSVLNSKAQLEEDLSKQLKQYGIFPDRLVDVEKLDLTGEKKQKRKDLEEILEKIEHKDTGDKTEQEYYVRKAAYTYFNRLAALKLMESHSLLDNIITPNSEFGGQPELLFHYRDITDIQNEDTLYESYFTGIFDDLDQEIGKIFDMDDQTSLLFPSSNAVDTVIEELDNIPQEAWKEEEIIGWMYQYFISEEKDDAFDKLNNDDQKINGSTLPAVTSLYTPHWIVEYLVDNTLGVMWKEMHPDTDIDEVCDYIVPDQEFEEREPKDIEEITLLDPACGSGHFLLYAFDVFYEMYKEEGYDEEEIPKKILENNLYGIDVDNRSSQLSALALYVKAKELTPDAEISQLNIISADAVLMNGEKKEKLLEKCNLSVEKEVIEEIWDNFQHLDERGSLVKIEEPVRQKISEHKAQLSQEDNKQRFLKQFTDQEIREKQSTGQQKLAESVSTEEYWDAIEDRMVHRVRELGEEAIQAQDMSEQLFATETEKTLHLLDYLMEDYDTVVANPPYLSNPNMSDSISSYLQSQYPDSSYDMYASFMERARDYCSDSGKVGMITQHTFLFLVTYSELREKLISETSLETNIHLGPNTFEEISGEKANFNMFTLDERNLGGETLFCRLVDHKNKKKGLEESLYGNKSENQKNIYRKGLSGFSHVPSKPFVYWADENVLKYFDERPSLKSKYSGNIRAGIITGDVPGRTREFWEFENSERWQAYSKGTPSTAYYNDITHRVDWSEEAQEFYKDNNSSRIRDERFHFREGIVFSMVGSSRFKARHLKSECLFDVSNPGIFPENKDEIKYLLGLLNSDLLNYILNILNPTLNFNVGDVKRIPYKGPEDEETLKKIENLVTEQEENRKSLYSEKETSREFASPKLLDIDEGGLTKRLVIARDKLLEKELSYVENIQKLNKIFYDIYGLEEEAVNRAITDISSFKEDISNEEEIKSKFYTGRKSIAYISRKQEVDPESIKSYLSEFDKSELKDTDFASKEVKRLLSYFIQVSLGRWEMDGVEPADDRILMVSTEVSSDSPSLMDKIRECIAAEWGQENVSDIESEINNILYHGMEKWIKKYFFKNFHYKMYNKRPVVWEIKTPNDHFKAFIYYHELDEDTLPKLQVDYIEPLMTEYNNKKNLAKKNDNTAEAEKLEDKVEDLRKLKEQLDEVIEEGYSPDLDEGVKHNFKPVENMTSKEMK